MARLTRALQAAPRTLTALAGAAALATGTSACGATPDGPLLATGAAADPPPPPPARVRGIGVVDGVVHIGTDRGLYTAGPHERRAHRAAPPRRDLVGFTVAPDGRLLASGHDRAPDGPVNAGLLASADGGRSWRTVSMRGRADFHVLQASGRHLYGLDLAHRRLMVSSDSGRTWERRTVPGPTFSMAVDPRHPGRVVAATEGGVLGSRDAARTWQRLSSTITGVLAWPEGDRPVAIDAAGRVHRSLGGLRWRTIGDIGRGAIAAAAAGGRLYAALGDGSIVASADGGRSWRPRVSPAPAR